MRYYVRCSAAPYENTSTDNLERAYDLCYNLSEDYGHAEVIEWAGPHQHVIAEYHYGR